MEKIKSSLIALELATKAHEGMVDRGGKPYINHPIAVASMVKSEKEKTVAYLHDVVEDTNVPIEKIYELFGETVGDAVALLTHDKNEPYMDYVKRVKANPVARAVKMADLTNNMDLSRLEKVTDNDVKRVEKYKRAYKILSD